MAVGSYQSLDFWNTTDTVYNFLLSWFQDCAIIVRGGERIGATFS